MTDATAATEGAAPPKKKSKLLLIAAVLALLAGGGGFYAVQSGLLDSVLPGGGHGADVGEHGEADAGHGESERGHGGGGYSAGTFVLLDPMIISLGPDTRSRHLKVSLAVDVAEGRSAEVEAAGPRITDMLMGFLRAVDEREFEQPRAMERLRSQMLRRIQLVSPPEAVQDLLIQEFLLN